MRTGLFVYVTTAAVGLLLAGCGGKPRALYSFEDESEVHAVKATGARVTRVDQHATEGKFALSVEFPPSDEPQIEFTAGEKPWDWKAQGSLCLDVTNPAEEAAAFSVEVTDAAGAKAIAKTFLPLRTHESASFALPLNSPSPLEMGMRGEPAIPGFRLLNGDHKTVDVGRIAKLRIFAKKPEKNRTLVIDNIRLGPGVRYEKMVDRFGQFGLEDWPGKLKSEQELSKRRSEEEAELAARPNLPDRDEYGGWSGGPKLEAAGYFRTAKRDGKWWLVTPSGHLFFSLGFNSVNSEEGDTVVEGREHMFEWLPKPGEPLSEHYGKNSMWMPVGLKIKLATGRTYHYYRANLEREYGKDWYERWREITLKRLPSWGFNTIANWSDPKVYEARRIPYVVTVDIDAKIAEVSSGNDYWRRMMDPFDPAFAAAVETSLRAGTEKRREDPWCIGYFVDNELSWGTMRDDRGRYGLALGALDLDATSPAKQAFVEQLRKRRSAIGTLNRAWGTNFASWDALLGEPYKPEGELSAGMKDDLRAFVKEFARKYFRTIRDTLKKYDPNHLYLGTRFAWSSQESIEACAEICDVMSFNIYRPRVERSQWNSVEKLGKPVIIGEFHMGAVDRGMFHPGLVRTEDQAARAALFSAYVRDVIDNPMFVGCHYFKYVDEPLTGRPGDGENYAIGFVNVADGLHTEMIEASRTLSGEMYKRRAGQ
jgi:agarase-like CBM domain-containing protein/glycosyl hydrolase family 42 (putative beta-galactosidase)